eukprot:Gb_38536 [translate_table: standard]
MGRSRSQRKSSRLFDSDDDSASTSSTGALSDLTLVQEVEEEQGEDVVLESHLDALYEKRASTREDGLKGLINAFTSNVQLEFAEKRNVTLLHQYTSSIKKGSASEAALAAHALGLLAITVGAGEIAHQVMQESIPPLSRACKLGSDAANRTLVLESLAVVTFVGGNDVEETERSMDLLWQLIQHKGNSHADQVPGTNKPQPAVRATAISAWAFLLTTIPTQRIGSRYIKQFLPTLSSLLKMDDRAVRIAAGEAIALMFETSSLMEQKGGDSCYTDSDSFDCQNHESLEKLPSFDELQMSVLEQMKELSIEAGGKGSSKKDLNTQRSYFREILASVEDGVGPETTVKLQHGDVLKVSTWTQTIQINLLRHFLGGGFQKHMQANPLLHDIFEFTPKQEKKQALSAKQKRMFMSPNSVISKARTQQLNKLRSMTQAGNHGHYGIGVDEDDYI